VFERKGFGTVEVGRDMWHFCDIGGLLGLLTEVGIGGGMLGVEAPSSEALVTGD
jgi:hypothetical protein